MKVNGADITASGRFRFTDPVFGDPTIDKDAFVSESAIIIGQVTINASVMVCPLAVIRMDERGESPDDKARAWIGKGTNIQECNIHAHGGHYVDGPDGKKWSVYIDNHCTFAHGAKGHGPLKVGKKCFVGFDAILHWVELGRNCFIDHKAVVKKSVIGSNCYISGNAWIEGVTIANGRYVKPGQVVITQAEADLLPPVPEDKAKEAADLNMTVVDENKHLCRVYKGRRDDIRRQRAESKE